VTKKKTISKKVGKTKDNLLQKSKSQKPILPKRIKNMLATSKAKLVLFEKDKQQVKISPKLNKEINIFIAKNPLDFYTSPHLMNLSGHKHIEKIKPSNHKPEISYEDLPGGKILHKTHIFTFIMLENSEILKLFKKLGKAGISNFRMSVQRARLASNPKIFPDKKIDDSGSGLWGRVRQISFINFIVFIFAQIGRIFVFIKWLFKYSVFGWKSALAKDKVISFDSKVFTEEAKEPSAPTQAVYEEINMNYGDDCYFDPEQIKSYNKHNDLFLERDVHSVKKKKINDFKSNRPIVSFRFSAIWKPALSFAVVALVVILPFKINGYFHKVSEVKGQVLGQAESALSDIDMAKSALIGFNLTGAEQGLSSANEKFVSAQKQLEQIDSLLTILADASPVGNTFKSGKNILELGDNLSSAGGHLLSGLNGLIIQNDTSLTTKIKSFQAESILALNQLETAQNNYKNIDLNDIPEGKRDQFNQIGQWLPVFLDSLKELNSSLDFGISFLGDNDLKRYLVVFQNDNELRATGGFMGSYALVDFKSGKIDKITIPEDGSYTARARLTELWQAPKALQKINARWEFHDANWWPDYPTSAQNIMDFYNKSGGPTIDGVITINSGWMKDLIAILGPVDLPGYGKTITAENYESELQKSIELESTDKTKPKKILGDLSSELLKRLFDSTPDKYLSLASAVKNGLSKREIMIYMTDPKLQKFVYDRNYDGRLKDASFDYLSVVSTNIGGGKTDNVVNQKIYHKASIGDDGSIIDTVLINRYHFGPTDSFFTKQTSTDYLRIYVPQGSQLLTVAGFDKAISSSTKLEDYLKPNSKLEAENNALVDGNSGTNIYNESGKTVFANWLTVPAGQNREAVITYKLPYKLDLKKIGGLGNFIGAAFSNPNKSDFYRILMQKQPGQNNVELTSEIEYPSSIKPVDFSAGLSSQENQLIYSGKFEGDSLYYVNFIKK